MRYFNIKLIYSFKTIYQQYFIESKLSYLNRLLKG
nr:MAG TPA: hypothetical protein [Bacteriophage sp.]DAW48257.1 MAG TPA: hypothetical protein [Caudoviricetes sp.]